METRMETREEGLMRLLPDEFVIHKVVIEAGEDLNIWQPIESEIVVNIGSWRIKEFLMDGRNSLILKYIYQMQCYALAFEGEKLDREVFEDVMFYTEKKIRLAEDNMRDSIRKADISYIQKAGLNLLLDHLLDKDLVDNPAFSKYLRIYKNHRTKVFEAEGN